MSTSNNDCKHKEISSVFDGQFHDFCYVSGIEYVYCCFGGKEFEPTSPNSSTLPVTGMPGAPYLNLSTRST